MATGGMRQGHSAQRACDDESELVDTADIRWSTTSYRSLDLLHMSTKIPLLVCQVKSATHSNNSQHRGMGGERQLMRIGGLTEQRRVIASEVATGRTFSIPVTGSNWAFKIRHGRKWLDFVQFRTIDSILSKYVLPVLVDPKPPSIKKTSSSGSGASSTAMPFGTLALTSAKLHHYLAVNYIDRGIINREVRYIDVDDDADSLYVQAHRDDQTDVRRFEKLMDMYSRSCSDINFTQLTGPLAVIEFDQQPEQPGFVSHPVDMNDFPSRSQHNDNVLRRNSKTSVAATVSLDYSTGIKLESPKSSARGVNPDPEDSENCMVVEAGQEVSRLRRHRRIDNLPPSRRTPPADNQRRSRTYSLEGHQNYNVEVVSAREVSHGVMSANRTRDRTQESEPVGDDDDAIDQTVRGDKVTGHRSVRKRDQNDNNTTMQSPVKNDSRLRHSFRDTTDRISNRNSTGVQVGHRPKISGIHNEILEEDSVETREPVEQHSVPSTSSPPAAECNVLSSSMNSSQSAKTSSPARVTHESDPRDAVVTQAENTVPRVDQQHQHDKSAESSKQNSEIASAFSSTKVTSTLLLTGDSKQSKYGQLVSCDEIPRRHHAPSSVNRGVVAQVPPYRHEMAIHDEVLQLNQVNTDSELTSVPRIIVTPPERLVSPGAEENFRTCIVYFGDEQLQDHTRFEKISIPRYEVGILGQNTLDVEDSASPKIATVLAANDHRQGGYISTQIVDDPLSNTGETTSFLVKPDNTFVTNDRSDQGSISILDFNTDTSRYIGTTVNDGDDVIIRTDKKTMTTSTPVKPLQVPPTNTIYQNRSYIQAQGQHISLVRQHSGSSRSEMKVNDQRSPRQTSAANNLRSRTETNRHRGSRDTAEPRRNRGEERVTFATGIVVQTADGRAQIVERGREDDESAPRHRPVSEYASRPQYTSAVGQTGTLPAKLRGTRIDMLPQQYHRQQQQPVDEAEYRYALKQTQSRPKRRTAGSDVVPDQSRYTIKSMATVAPRRAPTVQSPVLINNGYPAVASVDLSPVKAVARRSVNEVLVKPGQSSPASSTSRRIDARYRGGTPARVQLQHR